MNGIDEEHDEADGGDEDVIRACQMVFDLEVLRTRVTQLVTLLRADKTNCHNLFNLI